MPLLVYKTVKVLGNTELKAIGGFGNVLLLNFKVDCDAYPSTAVCWIPIRTPSNPPLVVACGRALWASMHFSCAHIRCCQFDPSLCYPSLATNWESGGNGNVLLLDQMTYLTYPCTSCNPPCPNSLQRPISEMSQTGMVFTLNLAPISWVQ